MCLSASANFAGSAVIGTVGVVTLRTGWSQPRARILASLPLLFALHQALEGVVWLGLGDRAPPWLLGVAAEAYMVYAQAVLPVLVPLAVWLIEPAGPRRRRVLPFVVGGAALGAYVPGRSSGSTPASSSTRTASCTPTRARHTPGSRSSTSSS